MTMNEPSADRTSFPQRIAVALIFWGALSLHLFAGPAVSGQRLLFGLVALVLFAVVQSQDVVRSCRPRRAAARFLAFVALAGLMTTFADTPSRSLLYAVAVLTLSTGSTRGLGEGLLVASLASSLMRWIPGVDAAGISIASWIGEFATVGERDAALVYGPSAIGLPAALWALTVLAMRGLERPGRSIVIGALLVPVAVATQFLLVDLLHNRVGFYGDHGHPASIFRSIDYLIPVLACAVGLGWGSVGHVTPVEARPRASARWIVLGLVGAFGLAWVHSGWRAPGPADRRMAFLNVGGFDWDRPTIERMGVFETGMFGKLPDYLGHVGWKTSVMGLSELPQFDRKDAQVLTLINCQHVWSDEERARVERFVRDGGSLLILGDHTDIFGLMKGFNSLLEPWGCRFRFDSAYHVRGSWSPAVDWKAGPLGHWHVPAGAGISIGASLETELPFLPTIRAHYGFSDTGIRENVQGSLLGDYAYAPGEQLGDLTLMAAARMGRGQVVVYGDTSTFQNMSLPATFQRHADGVFERLARPGRLSLPSHFDTILALLLLAGTVAAASRRHVRTSALPAAALAYVVWAAGSAWMGSGPTIERMPLHNMLLIDHDSIPDIGHYEANYNYISPVTSSAMRSGMDVVDQNDWSSENVRRARVSVLIAPRRRLDDERVGDLMSAMRAGSTVVAAATGKDAAGLQPLLDRVGVTVGAMSLGSVPGEEHDDELEPHFVDASPLHVVAGREVEELYRYGDHLLAVAVSVGEGHLIVIGDTRFFSQQNIEGRWGWRGGNVRFLYDIWTRYAGAPTGGIAPRFPAPDEP